MATQLAEAVEYTDCLSAVGSAHTLLCVSKSKK